MKRRQFIVVATGSAVALSGCSGSEEAEYEEGDEDAMSLSVDDFPDGWERVSEPEYDVVEEDGFRKFINEDDSNRVLSKAEVHSSVEDAREKYSSVREEYAGRISRDFADQSVSLETALMVLTIFRQSNAVGQVIGRENFTREEYIGDRELSLEYAQTMHQKLESL